MSKQIKSAKTPRYKTQKPRLSEATIAKVRKNARRYLLAGGSLFPDAEDVGDRDQHIGNVREQLHPGLSDRFEAALKKHVPDYQPHESLWSIVWELVGAEAEAGFAFGVAVGSEARRRR